MAKDFFGDRLPEERMGRWIAVPRNAFRYSLETRPSETGNCL